MLISFNMFTEIWLGFIIFSLFLCLFIQKTCASIWFFAWIVELHLSSFRTQKKSYFNAEVVDYLFDWHFTFHCNETSWFSKTTHTDRQADRDVRTAFHLSQCMYATVGANRDLLTSIWLTTKYNFYHNQSPTEIPFWKPIFFLFILFSSRPLVVDFTWEWELKIKFCLDYLTECFNAE